MPFIYVFTQVALYAVTNGPQGNRRRSAPDLSDNYTLFILQMLKCVAVGWSRGL